MTALSEALEAAQRRALAALQKAYVAGQIEAEPMVSKLALAGITDPVEIAHLLATLDVLKEWGAPPPVETNGKQDEPITERQKEFLTKLVHEKQVPYPDKALTKERASEAINELQAGTYDPDKWTVPF